MLEERRPDGSFEYEIVVITVPRQTGKTTLIRAVCTKRAMAGRSCLYTAQTGKDARARWMDLVKLLDENPMFAGRYNTALRGGSEHITFKPAGGIFQVFAPTPKALHGSTPATVVIDEAFAQTALSGELLMGAIGPAQQTIRERQIVIVSTAGTAESTFLHDWVDRARDGMPRVALLDWGARDDQDPYDLDDIAAFHPGVGFQLNEKVLAAADVLAEADKHSRAEYERAFANRRTLTANNLIPPDVWRELGIDPPPEGPGLERPAETRRIHLAYDVAADRRSAAILAAWPAGDRVAVKPVRLEQGTAWLADAVADLVREWRPASVKAVGNGPVLDVTKQLVDRGVEIDVLTERDFATASSWWLTAIDDRGLVHDKQLQLEQSVTGLAVRGAVVDGVAFSRRHSVGDSAPAIAAVVAAWSAARRETSKPLSYFPGSAA